VSFEKDPKSPIYVALQTLCEAVHETARESKFERLAALLCDGNYSEFDTQADFLQMALRVISGELASIVAAKNRLVSGENEPEPRPAANFDQWLAHGGFGRHIRAMEARDQKEDDDEGEAES
jgi:hypothetical protein